MSSYVIYTSSGTVLTTIPPGKINTGTTSLFLVGKDTLNYGRYFNQNLVNMLTNFSNAPTVPPANPLTGQLWFDSSFNKLRVYTSNSNFELVNQAKFSPTPPIGQEPGEFWFDLERRNLNFLDEQGQYQAITSFPRDVVVGWVQPHTPVYDNDTTATNRKYVTLLESYGEVTGVLSTSAFIADSGSSVTLFEKAETDAFKIINGITLIGGIRASFAEFETLTVTGGVVSTSSALTIQGYGSNLGAAGTINVTTGLTATVASGVVTLSLDAGTLMSTTAVNLNGGLAGQFAYQSAPNTTAFASTGSMYVYRATLADSVINFNTGTLIASAVTATSAATAYSLANTGTTYVGRAVLADTATSFSGGSVNATTGQFSGITTVTNNTGVFSTASGALQVVNGGLGVGGGGYFGGVVTATSFSSSGTVSLSGGTANGILYLNSSTVVTSGSALTWNGTTFTATNIACYGNVILKGHTARCVLYTDNGSYLTANTALQYWNGALLLNDIAGHNTTGYVRLAGGDGPANGAYVQLYGPGHPVYPGRMLLEAATSIGYIDFSINTTTKMTLDRRGNLGIGVTPSAWVNYNAVQISGGNSLAGYQSSIVQLGQNYYYDGAERYYATGVAAAKYLLWNGSHIWYNASSGTANALMAWTQAMTLDTSGNLLVAKTAQSATTVGFEVRPTGGFTSTMSASADATSTSEVYSTGAAAYRFYVGLGGTVYATNTTISAISDQRLKENIRDLDVGLNAILALKPRTFDWKAGKGKDKKDDRGFIAQEFEQVFPDLIDEWKDPAPEGEAPYKAVRQDLIPVLVKAIQEQQALIQSLTARVAQLEKE